MRDQQWGRRSPTQQLRRQDAQDAQDAQDVVEQVKHDDHLPTTTPLAASPTGATYIAGPNYFTPKNIRAAAARLAQRRHRSEEGDEDEKEQEEQDDKDDKDDKEEDYRVHRQSSSSRPSSPPSPNSAQEMKQGAASSGNHFWFGCGKLKKKIEKCRVSTMKMRSEISALGLKPQVRKHRSQHGSQLRVSILWSSVFHGRHGSIEVVLTFFLLFFFSLVCFQKNKINRCPTRTIGSPTMVVSRKTWSRAPTNRRTGTGARPAGGN